MEEKNKLSELAKQFFKGKGKIKWLKIKIVIALILIIVILAGSVYYINVYVDGSEREEDWSSVPYAASSHASGTTVNADGTMTNSNDIQETWNRMVENGSRVELYLDSPEELSKLINAELTTQMPDTRPNPDVPIDWNSVDLNSNIVQGIVKFKRADSSGNISTLIYAEPHMFDSWIEEYANTGSETAKNQALSHFTIKQNTNNNTSTTTSTNTNTTTSTNTSINTVTSGRVADVSQAIVNEATKQDTYGLSGSVCQTWVGKVYENSVTNGYIASGCCAYWAGRQWGISSDFSQIVNGAAVWTGEGSYRGTTSCRHAGSGGCGHAGIYYKDENGNDWVLSLVNGRVRKDTLQHFLEYYGQGNTPVWGWHGGIVVDMEDGGTTSSNTSTTQTQNTNSTQDSATATTVQEYYVEVAKWSQTDSTLTTDDPNVTAYNNTSYQMSTEKVYYKQMIDKYTMPFDLLWALLVIGEDKDFVMELADLAYNSQIEITIHDKYNKNTQVDKWTYTQETKNDVNVRVTATGSDSENNRYTQSGSTQFVDVVEDEYTTTKTVVHQENTLYAALTKADVWYMKYEVDYQYSQMTSNTNSSEETQPDQEFSENPQTTSNTYTSPRIDELREDIETLLKQNNEAVLEDTITSTTVIHAEKRTRYINILDNITNTTEGSSYTSSPAVVTEKVDESTAPNFVTIFNKSEYRTNKSNMLSADDWLFEILENNASTKNMVDLIKYLLYKATNVNYGIATLDFSTYNPNGFTTVTGTGNVVNGDSIQATVWYSLRNAGYSEIETAAVMGNIGGECDWRHDLIEASTGNGYGLIQWSFDRRTKLEAFAASRGTTPSDVSIQVEFLLGELNPNGGADGYATYQMMTSSTQYDGVAHDPSEWSNATDVSEATKVFCYCFERPRTTEASSSMQKRINYAIEAYNQFHGITPPSTGNNGGADSNSTEDIARYNLNIHSGYIEYKQGDYDTIPPSYNATGTARTIKENGCMPTSISIILSGLGIKDGSGNVYTPQSLISSGTIQQVQSGSSYYENAKRTFERVGLSAGNKKSTSGNAQDILNNLRAGNPILIHASTGFYTSGGHYMTLIDISGEDVYLSNPGSRNKNGWVNVNTLISRNVDWYAVVNR